MRLLRCFVALALLAMLGVPGWAATEAGPKVRHPAADAPDVARVIVKYRADSALMQIRSVTAPARTQQAAALGQRLGLALTDGWSLGARTQALHARGISSAELVRRLVAQPDVEWAVVSHRRTINSVPNDPLFGPNQTAITPVVGQWYLRAPDAAAATDANTVVSSINAVGAWDVTAGSAAITVAVLDTGVRFDHPDLAGKLYPGYDFISHAASEADGDGRDADASDPGDFSTASDSCGASSSSWHGTETAGLIGAATNNGIGMAGTGRDVMVLPVRVLGTCGGFDDDIQAGMLWAGGVSSNPFVNPHPAQVINMSLGSPGACEQSYKDVIAQLAAPPHNVTVVIAAGNDEGLAVGTPANCPGAIAVAGLRHIGTKVGFSDIGAEIAISAPAGNCVNLSGTCLFPILTTTNAGATTPTTNTYSDGNVRVSLGTSFSAPQVAGAAALMLSFDPTLTPAKIKTLLQSSARPFPTTGADAGVLQCQAPNGAIQDECYCTTTTCGAGMLDVSAAVSAVVAASSGIAAPSVHITPSSGAPTVGDTVTLSSLGTGAFAGRTIASYQWAITDGGTLAALDGSSTSTATLATHGTGNVTVQLTVVDSGGASASKSVALAIQAAPPPPDAPPPSSGGGAFSAVWLALLVLAVFALRRRV